MAGKLENGEDGIYNMIANDKNIIFSPKISITEEDIAEIPGLKDLRNEIEKVEERAKSARGKKAFLLKKQAIEMRQDQSVLKNSFKKPIICMNLIKSISKLDLSENVTIDIDGNISSDGFINLFNDKHISILLCNFSKLKEDSWCNFNNDLKWIMFDLDTVVDNAL